MRKSVLKVAQTNRQKVTFEAESGLQQQDALVAHWGTDVRHNVAPQIG